ncbi:putative alpha-1,3-mannosyltransferase MNN13 [Dirofilaria immitis]
MHYVLFRNQKSIEYMSFHVEYAETSFYFFKLRSPSLNFITNIECVVSLALYYCCISLFQEVFNRSREAYNE